MKQKPNVTPIGGHMDGDQYSHPAYGVIRLSSPAGNIGTLFGSDVGHAGCISIEISRAVLNRGLSNDWIHHREGLIRVEMSHAQFAQFITSVGKGDGTPCTIRQCAPEGSGFKMVPEIDSVETKHQMLRREVENSARERVVQINKEISRLGAMIEEGRLAKRDLRDMHANLQRHAQQLSGSIGFVVEQAQEALEKATSDAKIEIESYIANAARRIGLDAAKGIGLLGSDHDGGAK